MYAEWRLKDKRLRLVFQWFWHTWLLYSELSVSDLEVLTFLISGVISSRWGRTRWILWSRAIDNHGASSWSNQGLKKLPIYQLIAFICHHRCNSVHDWVLEWKPAGISVIENQRTARHFLWCSNSTSCSGAWSAGFVNAWIHNCCFTSGAVLWQQFMWGRLMCDHY